VIPNYRWQAEAQDQRPCSTPEDKHHERESRMSSASFSKYDPRDVVSRKEAAALLGVSGRTLEAWASAGGGPPYVRMGQGPAARVRYRVGALSQWLTDRERQSTTESAS
jgi:hypothetical protein